MRRTFEVAKGQVDTPSPTSQIFFECRKEMQIQNHKAHTKLKTNQTSKFDQDHRIKSGSGDRQGTGK